MRTPRYQNESDEKKKITSILQYKINISNKIFGKYFKNRKPERGNYNKALLTILTSMTLFTFPDINVDDSFLPLYVFNN